MNSPVLPFAEKNFFLDEFHDKSCLFAVHAADAAAEANAQELVEVCSALLTNETRVLLLMEAGDNPGDRHVAEMVVDRLSRQLALTSSAQCASPIDLSQKTSENLRLAQIWSVLRTHPLFIGLWSSQVPSSFIFCVQQLAVRLKVHKLILLDPGGGVTLAGNRVSSMNGPVLGELLRQGEAEWAGLGDRRRLLETVRAVSSRRFRCAPSAVSRGSCSPMRGVEPYSL